MFARALEDWEGGVEEVTLSGVCICVRMCAYIHGVAGSAAAI